LAEVLVCPEAAARGEHFAQVIRQPFIHPEQFSSHGLIEVWCSQPGGAAILAVPGVDFLLDRALAQAQAKRPRGQTFESRRRPPSPANKAAEQAFAASERGVLG